MKNASTWPGAPRITAWATATGGNGIGGISVWTTAEMASAAAALTRPATAPAPGPARSSGGGDRLQAPARRGSAVRRLGSRAFLLTELLLVSAVVPAPGAVRYARRPISTGH